MKKWTQRIVLVLFALLLSSSLLMNEAFCQESIESLAYQVHITPSSNIGQWGWDVSFVNDGIRKAVSADVGRGWSSSWENRFFSTEEWLIVYFDGEVEFNTVDMWPRDDIEGSTTGVGKSFPYTFEIQVSNDTMSWTTVLDTSEYPMPVHQPELDTLWAEYDYLGYLRQRFQFPLQKANYLRVHFLDERYDAPEESYLTQLTELEVFNLDATSVSNHKQVVNEFVLSNNYPNPFNPQTTIEYQLPAKTYVSLKVFDINGQEVATLVRGEQQQGHYSVNFSGHNLASGIYIYQLKTNEQILNKRMLLIK